MTRLLKGEGWVELLFASIAISVFGVWLVTVQSSRLNSLTLWESWQSQHQPTRAERVTATVPNDAADEANATLTAR